MVTKMKFLHVVPHYYPAWAFGGTARVAYELTRGLAARGHQVTVFTTDALDSRRRIAAAPGPVEVEGVRVFYFRNRSHKLSARFNFSTPRALAEVARVMVPGFDLVHCHELRTVENLLVTPVAAEVPLVLSPHGTLPYETGRGFLKRAWDWVFGRALVGRFRHVAALTEHEAEQFCRLWRRQVPDRQPGGKIEIIPNGVHLADFDSLPLGHRFRARYRVPDDVLLVLFLGRLHRRKGVHILIEALAGMPGVWLAVVGPDEGMRASLEAQAVQAGVRERVVFTGFLDGEEKLGALAAAGVFALPAMGEGLSVAVLEAGAAGLPLLLGEGCYMPEVEDVGAGMVLGYDPVEWAAALRHLLTGPAVRASMGRAARRLIEARFTWPAVLDRLEAFYGCVLRDRRS